MKRARRAADGSREEPGVSQEAHPVKPRSRNMWKYALAFGLFCLVFVGALSWYVSTESFQALVRSRLVAGLERITGGRVELGSVHTVPFEFQVEARNLIIHGRESRAETPYLQVDRLVVRAKPSVLSLGFGFRSIVFEHPVIHVVFYPDGTSNQPSPRLAERAGQTSFQKLFSLSVDELSVRRGELFWSDQRIPIDFSASDVSAEMSYSLLRNRYEASLLFGRATSSFEDFRPIAWTAAIHFRLSRNNIDVRSLKISTGTSRLEASGSVYNFDHPKITGSYDAVIDLQEAGAIFHLVELRKGMVEAAGEGSWTEKDFSSVGKLHLRDLDWRSASFNLQRASLETGYSIDPSRIALPDISGKSFGGLITGSGDIADWQNLFWTARARSRKTAERNGTVRLKLKDLAASEIASSLSTARRPFNRMNVVGSVGGAIDAEWKGSPKNAIAHVALGAVAPADVKPGELGVSGHTDLIYRRASGEIEISDLLAATKATQVRAAGTLSSAASVKLSVTTTNLGEWQPVIVAAGYDEPVPITLRGPASFTGLATGRLSSITFTGKLQSGNFDFIVPRTARIADRDVHWESLVTNIRLSPAGLALKSGTLRRADTTIAFNVNLGLEDRKFTPSSPFTASVNMVHANLAEVLDMAGYDYPATGIMDLSSQFEGTRNDPSAQGHVHLVNAVIYGHRLQQLNSAFNLGDGQIILSDMQASQAAAQVGGDASYAFSTRAFTFNLTGTGFDLSRVPALRFGLLTVQGGLDFVAHGSGTVENPALNANIRLHDLTLNRELMGDFVLSAASQGPELHLSGTSQFKGANLALEGNIQPTGEWPANLNLNFSHLDADSVLTSYLRGHLTGHSAVSGELHVEGPLRNPQELDLAGNLSAFSAGVDNLQIRNDGNIRFVISKRIFRVNQFHLLGDDTDLSGDGSVELTGQHRLDFRARGHVNLQLIQSYDSNLVSAGSANVDLNVAGTAADPQVQGRVQIANGSIAYADSPSALSEINGALLFNQNRFEVQSLTGRVGGGLLVFRGNGSLHDREINFDLGLHGEGVRLRYPSGVSSTANLDLQFTGNSAASTLSGDVTVIKVAVTPGFDFGTYLQRTSQSSALSQTNPVTNGVRLDVHIQTVPNLQMQTAVLRLSGDADLHLRGSAAKPVLLGRADVLEGQAYFNGTRYRLERGDVTFANPVTTDPVVDLQASTQVRDYEITLGLNGPVDKLNLTYRSEPPLPTGDIIALLAFGQTSQESTQLQQPGAPAFNQEASNAILESALNATVSNRAHRIFGVSHIKIDPQGLNTETSPTQTTPAITIDQQVANNITLSYSTNVAQTSQQIIQGEYNVSRSVSVVAIRDQNGVVSLEVRVRQRRK